MKFEAELIKILYEWYHKYPGEYADQNPMPIEQITLLAKKTALECLPEKKRGECSQGNCPYFMGGTSYASSWSGSPDFWETAKKEHEAHSGVEDFNEAISQAEAKLKEGFK
jgi:hypothetical protein